MLTPDPAKMIVFVDSETISWEMNADCSLYSSLILGNPELADRNIIAGIPDVTAMIIFSLGISWHAEILYGKGSGGRDLGI